MLPHCNEIKIERSTLLTLDGFLVSEIVDCSFMVRIQLLCLADNEKLI